MINESVIEDIRQWGYAKGILREFEGPELPDRRLAQWKKTEEELWELYDAIEKGDRDAARDAVGDICVTLVMQAELWDTGLGSCIYDAYQEIKNRTGKMVDGQFVKDSE